MWLRDIFVQVGAEVHGILLWPLGGLAFVGHTTTPKKDVFVSISGPLTHIPQFLIWFAILAISSHEVYHGWSPSLAVPDPRQHFWLALCAGASQVSLSPMPCLGACPGIEGFLLLAAKNHTVCVSLSAFS